MPSFSAEQKEAAAEILTRARAKGVRLVTAESCTGGLIAACLTEIPGSSDVVEGGFITYSNRLKTSLLDVPADTIETHGAVSAQTAAAMAAGALAHSTADIAIAVTGIAGPDGGTPEKPVGLVWFGIGNRKTGEILTHARHFDGDRAAVRAATLEEALSFFKKEIG